MYAPLWHPLTLVDTLMVAAAIEGTPLMTLISRARPRPFLIRPQLLTRISPSLSGNLLRFYSLPMGSSAEDQRDGTGRVDKLSGGLAACVRRTNRQKRFCRNYWTVLKRSATRSPIRP